MVACNIGCRVILKLPTSTKKLPLRGEKHFVYDAILRQLAHYSYHVGQNVFYWKNGKGSEWKNLSVPKGGMQILIKK
jgi:hypothetical protein